LPVEPAVEELSTAPVEPFVQLGDEVERIGRQHRTRPRHARRLGRDARPVDYVIHARVGSMQIE
jgi:hypothetical protein